MSLVKHNICEYNEFGQYGLGPKCYIFFAVLAGLYLFSPDGKDEIGNRRLKVLIFFFISEAIYSEVSCL